MNTISTGAVIAAVIAAVGGMTARVDGQTASDQSSDEAYPIAAGPFEPTWESLTANYQCPEWFRDAKFGIWAHWTAQCVPEQGDWYARNMYLQGARQYDHHVKHYGHPSEFGFMEFDNLWKAENWDPDKLMKLYKAAGAKFFVALANHHDNFDCYDSKYHEWNSLRVGPKKDIVGIWAKVAREHGLRFGVSNHSAHAWHWFQPAYGYDPEGPRAGVRYDAYRLTKADGQGKWWQGLDPQQLYTGRSMVMPDGFTTIKAADKWHEQNDREWTEQPPPNNPEFTRRWLLRCRDLVDKYDPDLLYFDDTELPLGQAGLDAAAHYYNGNVARRGSLQAVLTAKGLAPEHRAALVEDYERGGSPVLQPLPWQTCTCIGQWHYARDGGYKSVAQVVRMLTDIVSKNGCLLLSIPVRGDGTIDQREVAFLEGMAQWIDVHGEGIFGSRPWHVSGEGPTSAGGGKFSERDVAYTTQDLRFTTKNGALYVFVMAPPTEAVAVKSLGLGTEHARPVAAVSLVGSDDTIRWDQRPDALVIDVPKKLPAEHVVAFRVTFN
jgi:alpha-L-fucosidase